MDSPTTLSRPPRTRTLATGQDNTFGPPSDQTSGALTPPDTPVRSDSVTSTHIKMPPTSAAASSTTRMINIAGDEVLAFQPQKDDYEICKEDHLGSGRFSSVFLARRVPASAFQQPLPDLITPPVTPTDKRTRHSWSQPPPALYAVKTAADKSSVQALKNEARILSHLTLQEDSEKHIVPFHGYDPRHNALVFSALPATLADLIINELACLESQVRTRMIAAILPDIAKSLTSSLSWMHSHGLVHADIKPANILLHADCPIPIPLAKEGHRMLDVPFAPVFADFTSSCLTTDPVSSVSSLGGGTWDYMPPELFSSPFPAPDQKADVYALGITLLEVVIGCSPFADAGGNRHVKMAMIKVGDVLGQVARNPEAKAKLDAVGKALKSNLVMDLETVLGLGLSKNPNMRIGASTWSEMWLENGMVD